MSINKPAQEGSINQSPILPIDTHVFVEPRHIDDGNTLMVDSEIMQFSRTPVEGWCRLNFIDPANGKGFTLYVLRKMGGNNER